MSTRLLAIYLNDHLAGATGGLELAKRAAGSNDDTPYGQDLRQLAGEIEGDRATLIAIMEHLRIRRDPLKQAGGWLAEKAGRAKLNGRLRGYSPLSRVVELEGLALGVTAKRSCWRLLETTFGQRVGDADLDRLVTRAEAQLATLADLREQAAREAFAEESGRVGV